PSPGGRRETREIEPLSLRERGWGEGSAPLREPIQFERIAVKQLLRFVRRYALHRALDHLPRVRIRRGDVRIVRLPHDVVDADVVPELHAGLLEPEVDVHLAPEDFAR